MASQCPGRSDAAVRGDRIARPWILCGIVGFGVLYGLVHAGVRLAFSENLSGAVAFSNVFAQTLSLGYQERQPPLYEWLVWLVQQATGPNLVSFLLINYGLLTATFVFLYLSALRLFDDQRWAMVASLSPLLLYQIGWNIHEGVTHSLVMACAMAASFLGLHEIERERPPRGLCSFRDRGRSWSDHQIRLRRLSQHSNCLRAVSAAIAGPAPRRAHAGQHGHRHRHCGAVWGMASRQPARPRPGFRQHRCAEGVGPSDGHHDGVGVCELCASRLSCFRSMSSYW